MLIKSRVRRSINAEFAHEPKSAHMIVNRKIEQNEISKVRMLLEETICTQIKRKIYKVYKKNDTMFLTNSSEQNYGKPIFNFGMENMVLYLGFHKTQTTCFVFNILNSK